MMAFHPTAVLRHLLTALAERQQCGVRQRDGLTVSEQRVDTLIQVIGRWLAEHGDMVNVVELETVHGEIAGRRGKDRLLETNVDAPRGPFLGEACGLVIGRGFVLGGMWGFG